MRAQVSQNANIRLLLKKTISISHVQSANWASLPLNTPSGERFFTDATVILNATLPCGTNQQEKPAKIADLF